MINGYFVCDVMCREVWDDTGGVVCTAETLHRLPQCTAVVTNTPQYISHSSVQSQQNAAVLKPPASVQQSSSMVSMPSSAVRQTDEAAVGLLAQLEQLVESCRLPDRVSTDLMNLFSQQLFHIPHTHSLPLQQVRVESTHTSSSGDAVTGGTGTSEVRSSEACSMQNNSGVFPAASAPAAQTWRSGETCHASDVTSSSHQSTTNPAVSRHQCAVGEMHSDSVNQLSLLTHLDQLQRMYVETAGNALRNLYTLQQPPPPLHVVPPAGSTAVDSTHGQSSSGLTTAGTVEDTVHSQSPDSVPRSD